MMFRFTITLSLLSLFCLFVAASPTARLLDDQTQALHPRTQPFFPESPTSCPICEKDYGSINSCAQAAPVLSNFTMIIFNPGAFIDVIKCACVDTFQAVFPQCVDCFIRTNQSEVLNTPDLPAVVDGMRNICAIQSTLLGNVSESNGDVTPAAPMPTSRATSRSNHVLWGSFITSLLVILSIITFS
ncbi:hypothetical protein BDZ94DRAFT_1200700 [Collybia nuda]|uniref:Uncharacterized protein n=1 Tax=Collybia nuda TaxID=64659 RepID=A0A9P5XZS6_9AGAR|nr:hypothetical protein BDZ94DRAFT_1200700 [Collybia nuda]